MTGGSLFCGLFHKRIKVGIVDQIDATSLHSLFLASSMFGKISTESLLFALTMKRFLTCLQNRCVQLSQLPKAQTDMTFNSGHHNSTISYITPLY